MRSPMPYRWLRSFLGRYRRQIIVALGLGLLTYGCATLLMFTSGFLIAKTADPLTTLFMVMTPVACVQLFGIGRPVSRYFERLVSHDWVLRTTSSLRLKLFKAAERWEKAGSHGKSIGAYLSALTADITAFQNLFLRVVFPGLIALLLLLGACILCGWFSWQLLLAMVLCGILCVLLIPLGSLLLARRPSEQARQDQDETYSTLTDDILGVTDWILSGRGEAALEANAARGERLYRSRSLVRLRIERMQLLSALIMGVALVTIVVLSVSLFQGNRESANWIAAFALGFFPLIEAFIVLPSVLSESLEYQDAVDELDGFMAYEDAGEDVTIDGTIGDSSAADRGVSVTFVEVTFTYPQNQSPTLKALNLSIPSGQKVALLGMSGSGKSTLVNLMSGSLHPDAGTIALEEGAAVRGPSPESTASLNQAPYLFDRSLRENLLLAHPGRTDSELSKAMEAVGLGEKLRSMVQGLDTPIGETGFGFSGGEAHRVALARVLLGSKPLVILDEPFSALDPETEGALLDTLFTILDGRTLVVVTHHLSRIECFDRVLFLENGTIALDGSPAELQKGSEHFRKLLAFDH